MRRLLLTFLALGLASVINAQRNPVDDLFDKYSGREGFTVVSISGKMFSMFSDREQSGSNEDQVLSKLKSIRILSVNDSTLNDIINFYRELEKKLDMSVYEELMLVKDGPDITKFLIVERGDIITELLVLTGGPGGNSMISIRGEMNLKTLSDLSKNAGIQELEKLENMEKKNR
jgi:hypothetical protein